MKVLVILGPTGVGKTRLSIELAKRVNGEIINADSMQVYRGLDIGTAKVKQEEMDNVPHHLFDIKDVDEEYTIYHYQKDCREKIKEIMDRGHVPILVGGTGLYIRASLYDYSFSKRSVDYHKYDGVSDEDLYQKLVSMDKDTIGKIDSSNRRRVINALMFYEENGYSITSNRTNKCLYDVCFIGLTTDRDNLYDIINKRVDKMIDDGLIEEVRYYYDRNILSKPICNGIGYREVISYLDGNISYDEMVDEIKRDSRRYAKRQYTFFRHQFTVNWFNTNYEDFNKTVEDVVSYLGIGD